MCYVAQRSLMEKHARCLSSLDAISLWILPSLLFMLLLPSPLLPIPTRILWCGVLFARAFRVSVSSSGV